MTTTTNVTQVKLNVMNQSQYDSATKNPTELYMVTDAQLSYTDLTDKPTIPTVDQTYSASSANAQSGVAVASAISGKQDTLTAGTGIDITSGTISVASPTLVNNTTNGLSILGTSSNQYLSTSIGKYSSASGLGSVAISDSYGVATASGTYSTCVGGDSSATGTASTAFGSHAKATANYAIQLGYGTNSEANSLYVATSSSNNYKILGSDGTIPNARLNVMTGADGTDAGSKGAVPAPTATDNTKFLRGDGTWAEVDAGEAYTAQEVETLWESINA